MATENQTKTLLQKRTNVEKCWLFVIMLIYSFGDGVQYPVQIKHFPGSIGHSTSNYESMGNSYSLNKFDPASSATVAAAAASTAASSTTIQIEPNDSQKNLLQAASGHDDGDIDQLPSAHTTTRHDMAIRTISTVDWFNNSILSIIQQKNKTIWQKRLTLSHH